MSADNPQICFVQCYYGAWPHYWRLWADSAAANSEIRFILVTDLGPPDFVPANVTIIKMNLKEVIERLSKVLGFELKIFGYHKLCDARPFYGLAFNDILEKFDYWGYCDMDVIFGNLDPLIHLAKLEFDVISPWTHTVGHCTLIRNDKLVNEMPLKIPNLRTRFSQVGTTFLDEGGYFEVCVAKEGLRFKGVSCLINEWAKKICFLGATFHHWNIIWGTENMKNFAVICDKKSVTLITPTGQKHEVLYFHFMAAKNKRFWRHLEGKLAFPFTFLPYGFVPRLVAAQELHSFGFLIRCTTTRIRSNIYRIPRELTPNFIIQIIKKIRVAVRGLRRT